MADLAGLAVIGEAGRDGRGQTEAFIGGFEQKRTAIAGRKRRIEGHMDGLGNEGWKQNSLLVRMGHAKAFLIGASLLW
jgi:hypothetical protein